MYITDISIQFVIKYTFPVSYRPYFDLSNQDGSSILNDLYSLYK
jgi:hypothetical protein